MLILRHLLAHHAPTDQAGPGGDHDHDVYGLLEQFYGAADLRKRSDTHAACLCTSTLPDSPRKRTWPLDGGVYHDDAARPGALLFYPAIFHPGSYADGN